MSETNDKIFWDSNLWIYLFVKGSSNEDQRKQSILLDLLKQDNSIYASTQVLNEVGNVLLKKYKYSTIDTHESFEVISELSSVVPLSKDISFNALHVKQRYAFSWFDSLIVAAALYSKCSILYTEDLHHGLKLDENKLTILNPFVEPPESFIRIAQPLK